MKATEFCYWLQGLFEIHNTIQLNSNQVDLIKKHLQMVFLHEKNPSKHFDFCKFLDGYLKFSNIKDIDEFVTKRIKNELNTLFVHVTANQFNPSKNDYLQPRSEFKFLS